MTPSPDHKPQPPRDLPDPMDERLRKMNQLHDELTKLHAQLEYLNLMLRLNARQDR